MRPKVGRSDATTLFDWFDRTARSHGDAVALDFFDRQVTYAELDELSARAALRLAELRLLPQRSRIALLGGRELTTYAGYLAILRLGHTVVPLAPDGPASRNRWIAQAASVRAAAVDSIRSTAVGDVFESLDIPMLDLGDALVGAGGDPPSAPANDPDGDAYVLFTSGTTGRPKGVPIRYREVSAFLHHIIAECGLGLHMRLSHTFFLTFDVSVFDMFAGWGAGSTLVVPRRHEAMLPVSYVNERRLTHWFSVPSLITYAQQTRTLTPGCMPGLQGSMFAGEPLTVQQAIAWREAAPHSTLANQYGPTELTVTCASYHADPDPGMWPATPNGTVPIGAIYPHLDALVVDERGRPSNEGELLVRGPQRFVGYLDHRDNAGRFARVTEGRATDVPAGEAPGPTDYYRTGDRVERQDGGLVHLGRLDRQVKVAGNRVELGEVEAVIREHPGVTDAAVVAVPDPAQRRTVIRAAYCGPDVEPEGLEAFVRDRLPRYMVPVAFARLVLLPRTANGKTDYVGLTDIVSGHTSAA